MPPIFSRPTALTPPRCLFRVANCLYDHAEPDDAILCEAEVGTFVARAGQVVAVTAGRWADLSGDTAAVTIGVDNFLPAELSPRAARELAGVLVAAAERAEELTR